MFTSEVSAHDSKLLQKSNLIAGQPRRAPHHVIQASEGLAHCPRSLRGDKIEILTSDLPHGRYRTLPRNTYMYLHTLTIKSTAFNIANTVFVHRTRNVM